MVLSLRPEGDDQTRESILVTWRRKNKTEWMNIEGVQHARSLVSNLNFLCTKRTSSYLSILPHSISNDLGRRDHSCSCISWMLRWFTLASAWLSRLGMWRTVFRPQHGRLLFDLIWKSDEVPKRIHFITDGKSAQAQQVTVYCCCVSIWGPFPFVK